MNVTTRQLQAFIAIARFGSFTRAAEEIFVTQAGLSLMVKDFEAQVGARLFDRTTRSVQLTPAGESLLPTARGILADWERATSNIGQISAAAEQRVSVAATPLIAASVLPLWLRDFHQKQPGIRVDICDLDRSDILQGIETGEVDLGLGAFFKPASGIERRLLATFDLVLVSGRVEHIRQGRRSSKMKPVSWLSLANRNLLSLGVDNPIQKMVDAQLRSVGIPPCRGGPLQNIQAIIAMVEAGHGEAVLPSFVAPACQRYDVTIQPLKDPDISIDFFVVSRKGWQKTDLATHLITDFREHFSKVAKTVSM